MKKKVVRLVAAWMCLLFMLGLASGMRVSAAMGDYTGNLTGATWYWPLDGYSSQSEAYAGITSIYGTRWGTNHAGVDIGRNVSRSTLVYPVRPGKVSTVWNKEYVDGKKVVRGLYVIVDHRDGYWSVYQHLSTIKVTEGQEVDITTPLGTVGDTGDVTGLHLHFTINYSKTKWGPTNNRGTLSYENVNNTPLGYEKRPANETPIGTPSINYQVKRTGGGSSPDDTIYISPEKTEYTSTQGKSLEVRGSITSGFKINRVVAKLDGSTYCDYNPNSTYVDIGDYKIGVNSFKAQNLSLGTHYIEVTAYNECRYASKTIKINVVNSTNYTVTFNANGGSPNSSVTKSGGSTLGTLPTPSRTGHSFDGWYTASSGGSKISTSTTVTGNVTYYAHWTVNKYTVSMNLFAVGFQHQEGGTSTGGARHMGYTTLQKTYGERFTLYRSDYTASSIPRGFTNRSYFNTPAYNNGTWKQYIFGQDYVTQPANNTSVEIYCEPITYTITYNLNGGTNASSNPSTYNVLYGVTFENPTRPGYEFTGWTNSAGQTITGINPGANANHTSGADLINKLANRTIGDQTVTANWKAKTYTLYLYNNYSGKNYLVDSDFANGKLNTDYWGVRDSSVSILSVDTGTRHNGYNSLKIVNSVAGADQKDLRIVTTTHTSQKYDSSVGDNKTMVLSFWAKCTNPGTKIFFRWGYQWDDYRSVTLTDSWSKYTVRMDKTAVFDNEIHPYIDTAGIVWIAEMQLEDGTSATGFVPEHNEGMRSMQGTYGFTYSQPASPSRSGYSFDGWYTATNGGTKVSFPMAVKNGHYILYAHWTPAKYTVSYNANGGSGAPSAQTKTHGKNLTLSSTVPTRSGYSFQGWATSKTGSVAYQPGDAYKANKAVTMYAVWKANTYKVKYDANGGTGAPSAQTKTYGKTLTLSSTKPTRSGYTFQGWATTKDGSVTYQPGDAYKANKAVTLYAVWKIRTYKVKFDANGGEGAPSAQTKTYGKTLTLSSTAPTRSGYTFQGWATSVDGSVEYQPGDAYKANKAVTLYAVWKINTYKVKFNANGGEGAPSAQTKTYGKTLTLSSTVPTRSGYTFQGWATSSGGSVAYQPGDAYKANKAVTLYAVWQAQTFSITTQPKPTSAFVNEYAQFFVSATGSGLRYEWQYSGDNGKTWKSWDIFEPNLSVEVKAHRNNYLFRCVITDANGKTLNSNTAKLTVKSKITKQPVNQTCYEDEMVPFTITATGPGLKYKWQFSRDGGANWSSWHTLQNIDVKAFGDRHGYLFRCVVTDENGVTLTSKTVKLSINSKMIAQPKNVSVVVGGEAQFSVKASGPVLRYKWYMSKDNGKNWSYWAGRPSFSATAVAARNGYLFKCEITGANDQTLNTKIVKLTVLPKISQQPADQSVALGKDAVFQAGAQGAGLQYKWYMSKDEGNTWNYYAAGSKLTVTGTKNRNGYLFRCEITDANGKVLTSNTVRLTVK